MSSTDTSTSTSTTDDTSTDEETTTEEEVKEAQTGFKFSGESKTYQAFKPDEWTTPQEIPFSEFEITETDPRTKTSIFKSPYDIDLTKGRTCCWIQCKEGDNFGGVILKKEKDPSTGIFTYTCQDWNRILQSKVYVILAGDMTVYDIVKIALVKSGLSTDGLHPIEYYDDTLITIPDYDDPYESLTNNGSNTNVAEEGNDDNKFNPFRMKPEGLYDKITLADFIKALVLRPGALIDFYMDENGVPRFEKYEWENWLKERWIFVDTDVYDVKQTFDITDMITQVAVKRIDQLKTNATLYTSEKLIGVNLAKFFGVIGDVVDNPVQASSNASSASGDTITATGKPSCPHCSGKSAYVNVTRTYKNECPFCGKHNLQDTPKDPSRSRIPEGEITCGEGGGKGGCDADFCINCGHEKMYRDAAQLTPVGASFDGGDVPGKSSSSSSSRSTSSGSTASSSSSSSDSDSESSDDFDTSSIAVEDAAKNKQTARMGMTKAVRKLYTTNLKLPGQFRNLHTNMFCMIMADEESFLMENISTIGKKMNGKYTRYAGYEQNRFYVEEVIVRCNSSGLTTELKINPFASDRSTFAKTQIQAEQALQSALGGGTGTAGGNDCTSSTSRTGDISVGWKGTASSQTPSSKALATIGNSGANYAQIARKARTPKGMFTLAHSMFKYQRYSDNAYGTQKCPRKMYASGVIQCNCADAAWFMKCVLDCAGIKNYILHGSPCGIGHYWNCFFYNGRWIMGDLCYWNRSHNEVTRM